MQLTIDNFDGAGVCDYTAALEAAHAPHILRRLNCPAELKLHLVEHSPDFRVPQAGGRVLLTKTDGSHLFTGYLIAAPEREYVGNGERGPLYRYAVAARSDEWLLDRHAMPARNAFVERTAGEIVKEMVRALPPGATFDTSAVEELSTLPLYSTTGQKRWSEHAAEVARRARASYRAHEGAIHLRAIGATEHSLNEEDENFRPQGLRLSSPDCVINDVTVAGSIEPRAHVRDYFLGDGYALAFPLSQVPFGASGVTFVDEEFRGSALDPLRWRADGAFSVTGGKLHVGVWAWMRLAEQVEIGGTLLLQTGAVEVTGSTAGLLNVLYEGLWDSHTAVAAFRADSYEGGCRISAVVNGVTCGGSFIAVPGRRYLLSTRIFATGPFRQEQTFHSSSRAVGGAVLPADARIVLEVHEVDPANPGSQSTVATVLYDGQVTDVPAYCDYVPFDGADAIIGYVRVGRAPGVEVRSTIPGQAPRSVLVGALAEGAACYMNDTGGLQFHPQYVPVPDEAIRVSYRGTGRALARVSDPASIAALARDGDDGVRTGVRQAASPAARTQRECEHAAVAILDDATQPAWTGEYSTWSDFLPSGEDLWPGDGIHVVAPSRAADFRATVREVEVEVLDLLNDRSRYRFTFANDAALPLGFEFEAAHVSQLPAVTATAATTGTTFLADLSAAEVTEVTSTTVTIDAGTEPPAGGGIEVRRSDYAWDSETDRNLVDRFAARAFTVTRLSRVQTYYLRQYDAAGRYSRYSAVLHVDYPL